MPSKRQRTRTTLLKLPRPSVPSSLNSCLPLRRARSGPAAGDARSGAGPTRMRGRRVAAVDVLMMQQAGAQAGRPEAWRHARASSACALQSRSALRRAGRRTCSAPRPAARAAARPRGSRCRRRARSQTRCARPAATARAAACARAAVATRGGGGRAPPPRAAACARAAAWRRQALRSRSRPGRACRARPRCARPPGWPGSGCPGCPTRRPGRTRAGLRTRARGARRPLNQRGARVRSHRWTLAGPHGRPLPTR